MRISMMHYMIVLSLLCGCLLLGREPEESIEVLNGEWTETGKVKKLYDTPLGAVYRFSLSNSYQCTPYSTAGSSARIINGNRHKNNCSCTLCERNRHGIAGILQFNVKKARGKDKRFVVLDFKVRSFPALTNEKTAEHQFQVVRSDKSKLRSDCSDITGILYLSSKKTFTMSTTYRLPSNFWNVKAEGVYYRPNFEPYTYRIIFDTKTGKNLTVIRNERSMISLQPETPISSSQPIEINTLGIIAQNRGGDSKYRRQILEISPPTIYCFDSPQSLSSLPDTPVESYPYSAYSLTNGKKDSVSSGGEWRQLKNHKNPDLQYAYALRLLYGNDPQPSHAVELLESAIREDHVLANYQLGLCYYRGYGVEPDYRKADKYLEIAERYGYQPANTLRALMLWNQKFRPKFVIGKPWEKQMVKALDFWDGSYCQMHDPYALVTIFYDLGSFQILEASPKRLGLAHWWTQYKITNKNLSDPATPVLEELDNLIRSGYRPACLTKAMFLQYLNAPAKEIVEPLRLGARLGDPECEVMLLEMEAKIGILNSAEFTPEKQLRLGEYPQYLLLSFAMNNPNFPGVVEFLKFEKNHARARQIWEQTDNAEARYLLGLLEWTVAFPYSKMHGAIPDKKQTMKFEERIKAGDAGFKYLKAAARKGVPEAMYLVARQYSLGDFPTDDAFLDEERARQEGRVQMKRAAAVGQLNARFHVLESAINDSDASINKMPQYLTEIEEFINLNHAPAYLLKARILGRMKRPEAADAYHAAEKQGVHDALRFLAAETIGRKQPETADVLWGDYIKADRKHREWDRYDVFFPVIKINLQAKRPGEIPQEEEQLPRSEEEYQKMMEEE